ncbi:fibronectin type III domain-containing protein [Parapedobacter soli]|uniref:fibronectin type III domain-containing protein n=1 Tax=Parapedobacter soli TaxID=416955 RepID=UPI0021C8E952|nr:fibronectin type III domain-containing protein [Parapedobacter soli]
MSKTIYNFKNYSDTQLDTEAENVFTKMSGNASFPTPTPELTVLETHLEEYRTALADAALGDRHKVEVKNQKREQLELTLRGLALYVEQVAAGDRAIILSAGFGIRKPAGGAGNMPDVADFRVKYDTPGSGMAHLSVKYQRNARLYRFEHRLVGAEEWTTTIASQSRVTLEGLESYRQYEFRAAYVGSGVNPAPRFSEILTTIIL